MSQANVELVRRGYEAFAQGDIEAALAMLHPDVRIEDHDRSLETPTTYDGPDGLLSLFATVNEGFSDVRTSPRTRPRSAIGCWSKCVVRVAARRVERRSTSDSSMSGTWSPAARSVFGCTSTASKR